LVTLTIIGKESTGSGAWNELEADVYDATLTSIEDAGVSQFDGKEQFKITFALDLVDEAGDQIILYKWVNKVLSAKSNLAGIIEACGGQWEVGRSFDLESLAGSQCRVMVNISDKTQKRYVADVLAPKKAAAVAAAPKAAAAVPAAKKAANPNCCVPGCKADELFVYDNDGNPFCARHAPTDD